ncbi:MAG: DegT/DnrJ/EryC1/StrS family aminotransferase [Candidatus Acidiferrales bacterium]
MRIPLSSPDITEQDIEVVTGVLRTPSLSLGPKVGEFERAISRYVGSSDAVAVSSGTSGLHLCIRALGISEGDEVIVPSFAFIAVANVVLYEKAIPVFVDIDPQTLNLDPTLIEEAITPRTRAIIVVHTFGCPAELSSILRIARRHNLHVIEDACEAIGGEYEGQKVGTLGDAGVFGFYPNKQITTGEGGAVVTDDSAIAIKVRKLRNQGRDDSEEWFQHSELGYNYRISDINCALGNEQLKRIDTILDRRESIARTYCQILGGDPDLKLPPLALPRRKISWFVYVVRLSSRFSEVQRDWIVNEMKFRGIAVGRYFAPIHLQPVYQRCVSRKGVLPVTEFEASRALALPFFNRIREEEIQEVCGTLVELIRSTGSPNA